jgi:hypothetical protein
MTLSPFTLQLESTIFSFVVVSQPSSHSPEIYAPTMIPGLWPFLTKVGQAISEPVNLGGRTELATRAK